MHRASIARKTRPATEIAKQHLAKTRKRPWLAVPTAHFQLLSLRLGGLAGRASSTHWLQADVGEGSFAVFGEA